MHRPALVPSTLEDVILFEEGKRKEEAREFKCVDAKQAMVLGFHACKLHLVSFI